MKNTAEDNDVLLDQTGSMYIIIILNERGRLSIVGDPASSNRLTTISDRYVIIIGVYGFRLESTTVVTQ